MPRVLTERAKDFLAMMPPHVIGDPNIQAAVQAMSNECDRIDADLADVVAAYFPHLADRFLYLWESSLGIGTPVGLTVAQRQQRVLAFIWQHKDTVPGTSWVDMITQLIGPTWTWTRHTPGSSGGVPINTIWVNVPYTVDSPQASDLRKLLETVTPANTDLVINYGTGFLVQESQIQEQPI